MYNLKNPQNPSTPLQVFALLRQGGLTQDLTLILSTNKHQTKQNKENKTQARIIYYKRSGEGFIVNNICCALLPATTSLKMPIVKKTCCVLLLLSFMMSFKMSFKMKIYCVLLPASLYRRYSCGLLVSSAVYFYQCVYQIECLRCQVPSREGLYEWHMLAIKIKKNQNKQTPKTPVYYLKKRRTISCHSSKCTVRR